MASQLFSPIQLSGLKLANRVVIAPMCQYSAVDGNAGAWHRMHLGNLAASGAGLVIIEATAVTPDGRITPNCLGLYSDDNARALGETLAGVRTYSDTPMAIQLAHAGRKSSSATPWNGGQLLSVEAGGWIPRAPSAIPHLDSEPAPHALEASELIEIRNAFVRAAMRAVSIGLHAIELHAAHGYLLHEFLSPLSNQRTDAYGGSLQNRLRYPLEIYDAVRAVVPAHIPVGVRVSATDWVDGGWDLEGTLEFAAELRVRDCAWIDVSTGGLSPQQKINAAPGFQLPFAHAVRESSGLPVMGVGLITTAQQAEDAVVTGQCDLVAVARAMLWDPHWPWHAAAELGAQITAPPQYWRSQPQGVPNVFAGAKIGGR
jgi:2,4-dienoyl-CoA reductase-like NADH-dependent reductase (Old Yellow Enzyme family)